MTNTEIPLTIETATDYVRDSIDEYGDADLYSYDADAITADLLPAASGFDLWQLPRAYVRDSIERHAVPLADSHVMTPEEDADVKAVWGSLLTWKRPVPVAQHLFRMIALYKAGTR